MALLGKLNVSPFQLGFSIQRYTSHGEERYLNLNKRTTINDISKDIIDFSFSRTRSALTVFKIMNQRDNDTDVDIFIERTDSTSDISILDLGDFDETYVSSGEIRFLTNEDPKEIQDFENSGKSLTLLEIMNKISDVMSLSDAFLEPPDSIVETREEICDTTSEQITDVSFNGTNSLISYKMISYSRLSKSLENFEKCTKNTAKETTICTSK